jgi:lysine decarboxylase
MFNQIRKKQKNISFHMPAHNKGAGLKRAIKKNLLYTDTTELPGFDNLHNPQGIIENAQEKLSDLYSSEASFFLVNGSTCGILAGFGAVFEKGDKVLLGRDSHISAYNAVQLFELCPVYVYPEVNIDTGLVMGYRLSEIEKALSLNKDIKGIFITSPNYFGIVSDLRKIIETAKKHKIKVILDEAHGAHLKFDERLPVSGTELKADIVIQSAHKTLVALNQGAYLHVCSKDIDINRLRYFLSVFQTSSPSYPVMISLDESRKMLQYECKGRINNLIKSVNKFTKNVNTIKGLDIIDVISEKEFKKDILRIVIHNRLNMNCSEIIKKLSETYRIDIEGAINNHLIIIPSLYQKEKDFRKLYSALKRIASAETEEIQKTPIAQVNKNTEYVYRTYEAFCMKKKKIPLENAENMISGDYIIPYPPGIPVLVPGERIDKEMILYLQNILSKGYVVNGVLKGYNINIIDI